MNTSRIESLLEQLLDKQDELILRIESLETTVEQQLTSVNNELNWLEPYSFAKRMLDKQDELLSSVNNELNWAEPLSFAKQTIDALEAIHTSLNYR